ncbi:hypothetical protein R3P38DRAFT_2943755, partial [Favolaschia claudopus]
TTALVLSLAALKTMSGTIPTYYAAAFRHSQYHRRPRRWNANSASRSAMGSRLRGVCQKAMFLFRPPIRSTSLPLIIL